MDIPLALRTQMYSPAPQKTALQPAMRRLPASSPPPCCRWFHAGRCTVTVAIVGAGHHSGFFYQDGRMLMCNRRRCPASRCPPAAANAASQIGYVRLILGCVLRVESRLLEAPKLQQRNATKPRVNTARGVPLVGKGKPSLGAHKAKQPPGHALTQRGTTQRRPARR